MIVLTEFDVPQQRQKGSNMDPATQQFVDDCTIIETHIRQTSSPQELLDNAAKFADRVGTELSRPSLTGSDAASAAAAKVASALHRARERL